MRLPLVDLVWAAAGLVADFAAMLLVTLALLAACLYGTGAAWIALVGDGRRE